MNTYTTLYGILGVPEVASENEIKTAFRKLAMQYHPDKNSGSRQSKAMFLLIADAYAVLKDPKKRREYDLYLNRSHALRSRKPQISTGTLLAGREVDNSKETLFGQFNYLLWDLEDLITDNKADCEGYVLKSLTFLDKWLLTPAGFPDYFMEARQRPASDPGSCLKTRQSGHQAYVDLKDYFYDIRRRMNRLLNSLHNIDLLQRVPDCPLSLIECALEARNLLVYYLCFLLAGDPEIPSYSFSNPCFREGPI